MRRFQHDRRFYAIACCLVFLSSCCYYDIPYGGDPNADLLRAVESRDIRKVRSVLKHRPELVNLEVQGSSPLIAAGEVNSVEIAHLLLDQGADVNYRMNYPSLQGDTALHRAVMTGTFVDTYEVVALLVEHGADVNARIEPYHDTVLHAAARAGGSIRTLRLLVQKGAKVNAEDDRGVTPLVCAGSSGWDEGVEFLLANGAVDTWGWRDVLLHSQSLTKRDQQTPARAQ